MSHPFSQTQTAKALTFRHTGKLGDIIYALPTVKALGGGQIFVSDHGELTGKNVASILSLLNAQPYVHGATLWQGESFDVDLDAFRENHPLGKNLADAHLTAFGLQPHFRDERWITLPGDQKPEQMYEVVIARTSLRPGPPEMWFSIMQLVRDRAVFVGSKHEHLEFCGSFGDVPFLETDDLLDLARVIDGAKLFIGNQSCPYAIAEGLKKPTILEVDSSQPNCNFIREGALQIIESKDLAKIESHIDRFVPSRRRSSNRSDDRSREPIKYDYYDNANLRILERVPPSAKRILDIGCATGRLGEMLKKQDPEREVWGIELVPEIARHAKDRLDNVLTGDVEKMDPLPFPERFFDCVVCGDVLEHMRRPEDVLSRLKPHLASGATLLCSVPNVAHGSVVAQLLQGEFRYEDKGLLDRTHLSFFTPRSFRRMLWDCGYAVHHEEPLYVPDERVATALMQAAESLGIHPDETRKSSAIYQTVFEASAQPNPYEDPEKMRILLGPHVGELGPAKGKRCSVIVLTYNSAKTLDECVSSVIPTLGPDDELICVDNASEDSTQEMLTDYARRCPQIKLIFNAENAGFSTGCNVGMLASSGEYIVLLNPDTRVWPNWIERLIEPLTMDGVGAVGPVSDRVNPDQFVGRFLREDDGGLSIEELAQAMERVNPGVMVETKLLIGFCLCTSRRILDQVGLLIDEMFLGSDDLELSWRLRCLGFRLIVRADVFVHHKTGASQESVDYDVRARQSLESATVLHRRLIAFYGSIPPISEVIWGNKIFPIIGLSCLIG